MISENILVSLRNSAATITEARQWDGARELLMPLREALQKDPLSAHAVMACVVRHDAAEDDYAHPMRNQIAIDCIRMVLPRYAKKALHGPGSRNTTPEQDAQLKHDYYNGLNDLVKAEAAPRRWREIIWYLGLSEHPMTGRGAIFEWAAKSSDALGGAMRYSPPILAGAKDVRRTALDLAYAGDPGYATACAVTDDPLEIYALMQARSFDVDESYSHLPDFKP